MTRIKNGNLYTDSIIMLEDVFAVVDVDKRKVNERIHAEISLPDSGLK